MDVLKKLLFLDVNFKLTKIKDIRTWNGQERRDIDQGQHTQKYVNKSI